MDIKVGVKYCGGCNPNYDRKEIANIIEKQAGINITGYKEDEIPDVALVICGCSSDCVNIDKIKSKYETILINRPEQLEEVVKLIGSVNSKIINYSK